MTDIQTKTPYYRVGGNLPPDAPSYVTRKADEQLYQKLKEGEFCYVLNCRQMGKSSLWVRVKQKLERENYICAAIDLSGIGQGNKQEWYASFASRLLKSFAPEIRKKWRTWRKAKERQGLASTDRLHQLIEELILPSLLPHQQLVIFVDEIDYVKGLPFSTDEFFALIRSCYNERSLNPQFNKVTFCLLGVATPADLIENKQLTPFNIGTGIELQGFREDEAKPLIAGLAGKVTSPASVMSEILYWTGGQPFLTQRLCNLVVKENNANPDISELVQRQIIDHWKNKDEQEHLRTIQNRILVNEQRVGYLLELYREILKQGQVPLNSSVEQRELQLSGLVVKRGNILKVYNPIYAKVFDEAWIDLELGKLRPYAENYRAWIKLGKTDTSRLLRGKALKDAEVWALGKNLGGGDQDFLGASRAKEREEESAKKAQQKILIGSIILGITLIGAIVSAGIGYWQLQNTKTKLRQVESQVLHAERRERNAKQREDQYKNKADKVQKVLNSVKKKQDKLQWEVNNLEEKVKNAEELKKQINQELDEVQRAKDKADQTLHMVQDSLKKTNETLSIIREISVLSKNLRQNGNIRKSDEVLVKAGISTLIQNEELKQTFLLAASADAYKALGNQEKAQEIINSFNLDSLNNKSQVNPKILNQVKTFAYFLAGDVKGEKYYQDAYIALKSSNFDPYNPNVKMDVLNEKDVENIYYRLIETNNISINSEINPVAKDLREHLYAGLKFLLREDQNRLQEADRKTNEIMLYIAGREREEYFTTESLEKFPCSALREIDKLWYEYSKRSRHFGFRVQKEIWQKSQKPTDDITNIEIWRQLYTDLGWKTEESGIKKNSGFISYNDLAGFRDIEISKRGNLPLLPDFRRSRAKRFVGIGGTFFSRVEECNL